MGNVRAASERPTHGWQHHKARLINVRPEVEIDESIIKKPKEYDQNGQRTGGIRTPNARPASSSESQVQSTPEPK
ncbi:hypothetical protein LTR37_007589 [Vermiconidia calcicola]|uniref:Uncharacterized protein n=1 Tax=Vermiconidia calcicola TaxID=1690605 RepID=A0ACC3NDM5_9PEZI|nr:hypothetical protein LTR37_007589 [Vermiconidia calcicola]